MKNNERNVNFKGKPIRRERDEEITERNEEKENKEHAVYTENMPYTN